MIKKLAINGGKPVRNNFLIFDSLSIEEEKIKEVEEPLRSGGLGRDPKTHKFEEMFKEYKGDKFAIALNSATFLNYLFLSCFCQITS